MDGTIMAEQGKQETTYRHDCPALGKDAVIPRALVANGGYVIYYQHKCVFCSMVAGPKVYAKGVRADTLGGYYIDTSVAEKLQ